MEDGSMIGQRVLSPVSQTHSVVAVHVTATDAHTTGSPEQLRSDMFFDNANLRTQFNGCSNGMLKMEPFDGKTESTSLIDRGVAEVTIDISVLAGKDMSEIQSAILQTFVKKFGSSNQFDHILFCMPPGTSDSNQDWLVNRYGLEFDNIMVLNNACSSVSTQMYALGFLFGLFPAAQGTNVWADITGYMGKPNPMDDQRKCFNPYNSWHLGWYQDHRIELDFTGTVTQPFTTTLVGINDYDQAINSEEYVVVKVHNPDGKHLYVGFNRAYGINADTAMAQDQVTVHMTSASRYGYYITSNLVMTSDSQSFYSYSNFGGSGHSLVIQVNGIDKSLSVWKASVTIYMSNFPPPDNPSSHPSSSPSSVPSSTPSLRPSSS